MNKIENAILAYSASEFPSGCCCARMCIDCRYLDLKIKNNANQFLCMWSNEWRNPKDRGCICGFALI